MLQWISQFCFIPDPIMLFPYPATWQLHPEPIHPLKVHPISRNMIVSGLDIVPALITVIITALSSFQIPRAVGQGDIGPSGPQAALRQARDTPVER